MADTETLKLNPEEKRAFDEAHKTTTDFVKRVGQPGSLDVPVDALIADDDSRVLVTSPRAFVLTLDNHRRVKFHAGINSVPVKSMGFVVAEHPYVKANGATTYNAPKTVTALGGSTLPDTVKIGEESIPTQQFISAAQLTSGLSIDQWNRLKPEVRDDMVARMIKARQDTVMPKAADREAPNASGRADPFSDANYKPGEGNTAVVGAMPAGGPMFDQAKVDQDRANQAADRDREPKDARAKADDDRDATVQRDMNARDAAGAAKARSADDAKKADQAKK
jgi:hypothetical protein